MPDSIFDRVKAIPTPEVFSAFFASAELKRDGSSGRLATHCIGHEEKTASLKIFDDGGWKCFGCNKGGSNIDLIIAARLASTPLEAAKLIADKFNIPVEQSRPHKRTVLTLDAYARFLNVPTEFLDKRFGLSESDGKLLIPYRDIDGSTVSIQACVKLEKLSKGIDKRFFWHQGKPFLYGAWLIPEYQQANIRQVLLVEGASDVHVLLFNNMAAVGAPGASTFQKEWADKLLPFAEIIIIEEPGKGGQTFVEKCQSGLKQAGYKGTLKIASLPEKDPRDLWLKDKEQFNSEILEAMNKAEFIELFPVVPRTAELIFRIQELLLRHVVFKDSRFALLIATWVLGSSLFDVFRFFAYLWFNSPEKRCGKSLVLDILKEICLNATPRLNNANVATIFRIAAAKKVMLLDEVENTQAADKSRYAEIMTLLNAGFQSGAMVPRCEKVDGAFVVTYFDPYCPKVLAGIRGLPDTIEDRCFKIPMVRKSQREHVERFNVRKQKHELADIQKALRNWSMAKRQDIQEMYDAIDSIQALQCLDDRFQDISEPLAAIGAIADGDLLNGARRVWPDLRDIMLIIGGRRNEAERSTSIAAMVELLKEIMSNSDSVFIASGDLLAKAQTAEGLNWIRSAKALSTFLGKLDLTARRDPTGKHRGYLLTTEWIDDVESRYCVCSAGFEVSEVSETRSQSGSDGIL